MIATGKLPVTYPARPTNGGPIDRAVPKVGDWMYEPKYNGWRALVYVPSGRMWNRYGGELTIKDKFDTALAQLKETDLLWADCEALERRHDKGRGSLIVFDAPSTMPTVKPAGTKYPYVFRKVVLEESGLPNVGDIKAPSKAGAYICPVIPEGAVEGYWQDMKEFNEREGCEFFEGLVAKKVDSKYPIQLRSPNEKFGYWIKHRFKA